MPGNLTGQARQERIERFTREARAAARLRHQNIVRIYEHGQDADRYYIAMEFLQGRSLRDELRQRKVIPVPEAIRIAIAAAEALDFAHRNDVVHRDIKPDNIHIEPDRRVVLTDFGIARITFEPTLTAAGQIFGTPSYMSPEQIAGGTIDRRTDLFSLGVMLYEMVEGRKPFTGESVISITYNITHTEPPPLSTSPPGLDQIIRCAMAKRPEERYRTAAEMVEDLRRVASGAPPQHARSPARAARPSVPPPPAPPPARAAQPVYLPPPRPAPPQPVAMRPAGSPPPARAAAPAYVGAYTPPAMSGFPAQPAAAPPILRQRQAAQQVVRDQWTGFLLWLVVAAVFAGVCAVVIWAGAIAMDNVRSTQAEVGASSKLSQANELFNKGKYGEALAIYRAVIPAAPARARQVARASGAAAASELAEQRLKNRRPEEALELAEEALSWSPASAHALLLKGRSLASLDRLDEALRYFDEAAEEARRAARAGGRDARAQRQIAASAPVWKAQFLFQDGVRLGRDDPFRAEERLQRATEAAPGSDWGRAARERLALLRGSGGGAGPLDPQAPRPPDPNWDTGYRFAPGFPPGGG